MQDWIGLIFFILVTVFIFLGLRTLGKNNQRTEEEFEKGAAEGGSLLSAGISALSGILNPGQAKGKQAITEMKKGRYLKKRREGKAFGKENK